MDEKGVVRKFVHVFVKYRSNVGVIAYETLSSLVDLFGGKIKISLISKCCFIRGVKRVGKCGQIAM